MKIKLKQLVASLILGGLLSGCALPNLPTGTNQSVETPKQWTATTDTQSVKQTEDWWLQYQDSQLNQLMSDMLAANTDLKKAGYTLRTAWLTAGLKAEDETPTVSASLNSQASRDLKTDEISHSHDASLNVSYSLDLWNKLKHTTSAAEWEAKATAEDLQETALSLTNTTAKLYWQIGYLNDLIASQQGLISRNEKLLSISQAKYRAGAVTQVDVADVESSLATANSTLLSLKQQQRTAANSLSLLLGKAPTDSNQSYAWHLPALQVKTIPAGVPADVLQNRPDILASSHRLEASLETVKASRASFLPEITLTGSVGSSSTQLKQVLNNPVGTLGVGVTLPFLQWGELKKNYAISETSYLSVINDYRAVILNAFMEVDNALTARTRYLADQTNLQKNLTASETASRINQNRYQAGQIEMSTWLSSVNSYQTAKDNWLENQYEQLSAEADLWLALGGKVTVRQ
ncbi:efflux transporter outer membrane subunit [Leeia sp. TBRC 13508]|uniref:Efflux transporter outer membrane subunit n=1 Tax=Leeia speluncae TaxID=2884804 RepID=A0ABS8D8V2_9NEIS|nr:efflux transporter outer membrane subunit [Leeia speluncae]MCB6184620.1 efflux transporter outer membrane subunit [Leeia speluncae]